PVAIPVPPPRDAPKGNPPHTPQHTEEEPTCFNDGAITCDWWHLPGLASCLLAGRPTPNKGGPYWVRDGTPIGASVLAPLPSAVFHHPTTGTGTRCHAMRALSGPAVARCTMRRWLQWIITLL